jgi:hypothetical protein
MEELVGRHRVDAGNRFLARNQPLIRHAAAIFRAALPVSLPEQRRPPPARRHC